LERHPVRCEQYFSELCESLRHGGALLVSRDAEGRPNAMTIGWAQLGVIWGRWVMTVLVRPSRYTYGCCMATGDFTVNVPYGAQAEAVALCGTKSGRDLDKFAACGFTAAEPFCEQIASPFIAECGLAYECKVLCWTDLLPENIVGEATRVCYPEGDYHRMFFGEVLATHADADFAQRFRG
jgi:flavin reductase (DIM6/NTAB) family NADH-FMN oxidoreductase RutF